MFFVVIAPPAGPKLYKEPSAKSNKHIIQNALAHCCLAGKVNEGQKRRILEVSGRRAGCSGGRARPGCVEGTAPLALTFHTEDP